MPWERAYEEAVSRRGDLLRSIAVINLKKEPGGRTAELAAIIEAASRDKVRIMSQLSLYDPDLIVCCGDGTDALPGMSTSERTTIAGRPCYRWLGNGALAVHVSHPNARKSAKEMYELIAAVAREYFGRSS